MTILSSLLKKTTSGLVILGMSLSALMPLTNAAQADGRHDRHDRHDRYDRYDPWDHRRDMRRHKHWKRKRHVRPRVYHHYPARPIIVRPGYSSGSGISDSTAGALLGAILGGLAGTQIGKGSGRTAAIIGGTVLGAVLGSNMADRMSESDHRATNDTLETCPSGEQRTWRNPDTGAQFTMIPENSYKAGSGEDCRDYTLQVTVDGQTETVSGSACRLDDGTWNAVQG